MWTPLGDVQTTLQERTTLGVGFVSLTEALDLTRPAGRACASFLAAFAAFARDVIRAARPHRPPTAPG